MRSSSAPAGSPNDDEDDEESEDEDESAEPDAEPEEGSGSTVKLRPWHQRKRKTMGYDADGRPAPLIDQVHRLMHLWKAATSTRSTTTSTPGHCGRTCCSTNFSRP